MASAAKVETLPPPNPSDIIDRVLEDIEKRYGEVSNEILLSEASNPDHPLHTRFEWDDSVAAKKYRLEQAAQMIRASKFIAYSAKGEPAAPVRRWISFPSQEGRYISRPKAMRTVDVRLSFIGHKVSALENWCAETVDVAELAELRAIILKALAGFGK